MDTARLFKHGGSQAVRLPKAYRMPGERVIVERHGDLIVLKPMNEKKLKTLGDLARHMASFKVAGGLPDRESIATQVRELSG